MGAIKFELNGNSIATVDRFKEKEIRSGIIGSIGYLHLNTMTGADPEKLGFGRGQQNHRAPLLPGPIPKAHGCKLILGYFAPAVEGHGRFALPY